MDDMSERRRPARGRGTRRPADTAAVDENPYRDADGGAAVGTVPAPAGDTAPAAKRPRGRPRKTAADAAPAAAAAPEPPPAPPVVASEAAAEGERPRRGRGRTPRAARSEGAADAAPVAATPIREEPPAAPAVRDEAPAAEGAPRDNGQPRESRDGESRFERRGRFRRRGRGRNRFRDEPREGGDDRPARDGQQHRPHREPREHTPREHREHTPRDHRDQQRDQHQQGGRPPQIVIEGEITGWFDPARGDGGFIRRAAASYLPQPTDPFVPGWMVRQYQLRRADLVTATWGHDNRRRASVAEVLTVNGEAFDATVRRKDFQSLTATYPEQRLTLETGAPARIGQEVTRRVIDLIAPIGYGQRALIVAPARAGKTTLLQAITEGVHHNHPNVELILLLVDERPEEVSEAISWNVGEVIASSFDQPAQRHVEVTEMVMERARRLVELGKDVVIVLDSITRMGRAFNTANRGTGRTLSGGLDSAAMARPKAFFGSARAVAAADGGGSLTIIATALVETGSRMDDVIFEEFKGTGNCEIKLDRTLSERRIFPAIDIPASGTRREEKLYKPDQLQAVYMLRRGLQQMPAVGAMEWLIKRILATPHNDALLAGL
jgi:transcription termination factor Rho